MYRRKNSISIGIYKNRAGIADIIKSGEAVTVTDIKEWIKDNGIAEVKDRKHLGKILKRNFPEYIVDGRWDPLRSMMESSTDTEDVPDQPPKEPVPSAKTSSDKKSTAKKEVKEDDDKVIRVLEDGTEIGEKALEFFDRRTIMESSEMTLYAFFMRKVLAKKYIRMKYEENDIRKGKARK